LPELTFVDLVWRLGLAALLGGAIGFERELRERGAGLRTHLLVSVGSALFTIVSAYAWSDWSFSTPNGLVFDPTRIAAQIVSGIGFLGAGAIIRQGLSVRGLTTAATLWFVAAIGMASGVGYWQPAVIATVGGIITLWPLRILEGRMVRRMRTEDEPSLIVGLGAGQAVAPVLARVEELGGDVGRFRVVDTPTGRELVLSAEFPRQTESSDIAVGLAQLAQVTEVRWGN
jgi:putative Mg2+ transporter-C (MgtC) family protein